MNNFTYFYHMKVYFEEDAVKNAITTELRCFGKTVMLVYGGGSIKKSGVYDKMITLLKEAGKISTTAKEDSEIGTGNKSI